LPAGLQKRVHEEVEQAKRRSGWPVKRTLAALGIARRSYYRWLKDEAWARKQPGGAIPPVSPYEALPHEKQTVINYACKHPELRHRELAWRMVDEDVAYVSPSTVYRILREAKLVCPWRRRAKRVRTEAEKATRPDQRWATDVMHVPLGDRVYYVINFMDEYSRYLVHQEVLLGMDGLSVSLAAQGAIETLPKDRRGRPLMSPEIRSDNGSGYISKEFRLVLKENGLEHRRIQPHCPEENGLIERANRTVRESLEEGEFSNFLELQDTLAAIRRRYNNERLHSALGYLTPSDFYRGDPSKRFTERRVKLFQARHRRREQNLQLRQRTLPLESGEAVTSN
jgi:putative transposase